MYLKRYKPMKNEVTNIRKNIIGVFELLLIQLWLNVEPQIV